MKTLTLAAAAVCALVATPIISRSMQPPDSEKGSAHAAPAPATQAQIQTQIDAFTRSLAERDVDAFVGVVSSEVMTRTAERGIDIVAFMEKQRTAILRTFRLADNDRPAFEVAEALQLGPVVRVTLRFRGKEIEKPFYFVSEGGAYKLNFGYPGFSKSAPAGALFARQRYIVQNQNQGTVPLFRIGCYQKSGAELHVDVAPDQEASIDCDDDCGRWFSGSSFKGIDPDEQARKCDWNWWGADVIINTGYPYGWACNDPC